MHPSATPPHLYVVEVGDTVVISTVKPDFPGTAGETAIERAIERLRPAPYAVTAKWVEVRHSIAAPTGVGAAGVIAQTIALAVLALAGMIVFGLWLSSIQGLLVGATIGFFALYRYGRLQKAVGDRWRAAHRVLAGVEKAEFLEVFTLADRVTTMWPELTRWVPLPYPGHDLARLLWDVVLKLEHRSTIRPTRDKLVAARTALRPVDARVKQDVDERLAEVERQLAALDREIERRATALRLIGDQCERFLHQQRAIEMAREAIRDADAMRGQSTPAAVADAVVDDLRDHVQGILTAYRELTRDA